MDRTKIDWCYSSWNPITGCRHSCEYCYARGIATRFGKDYPDASAFASEHPNMHILDTPIDGTPYPFKFDPTYHYYRLNDYMKKTGRSIFVCSMSDLFGEWVPEDWITDIFDACKRASQHVYIFLTKNPKRYIELLKGGKLPVLDNMWYGTSLTNSSGVKNAFKVMADIKEINPDVNTFFSIEPLLDDVTESPDWNNISNGNIVDFVIVGAESGNRKDKVVPKREWLEKIVSSCGDVVTLFMKSSLSDIWGDDLITNLPYELRSNLKP